MKLLPVRVIGFSTSSILKVSDEDLKNDPDVKKLLSEINKDFEVKSEITKPHEEETVSTREMSDDIKDTKENVNSGKNISQLLSELYSEEVEPKDKFSSVGGYKEYVDSDSSVIYDVDEEREIMRKAYLEGKPLVTDKKSKPSQAEKYRHLLGTRGARGVFEISELVSLLKSERIGDIAVIKIPAYKKYADYMVVGTARSTRHLRTVSSLILSVYKKKRLPSDPVPAREGESDTNTGWTAMDMGNIVVHLLTQEQREYYDLEMLWTVGPEFDDNTRKLAEVEQNRDRIDTLEDLMATEVDMEELFGKKIEYNETV